MNRAMLRVTERTRDAVRALAEGKGSSMQQVVEEAIEAYRRQVVLEQANEAYAHLRKDRAAWNEMTAERELWDETLADGIEDS